eukprot:TRINITY_DN22504_c0_g1_i1.p1 TRINITY_DN22504_c0_g1~~TRINITY_DN22504_c0_g1_i1.p1  ORF type:complete len:204 (+),score=30.71 TRINITY_DN22504_c0_g1_i1:70-612(+)
MLKVALVIFGLFVLCNVQSIASFRSEENVVPLNQQQLGKANYCADCITIVGEIEKKGCSYACKALPPPASLLCTLLLTTSGLCTKILDWLEKGFQAPIICELIGMCSHGNCVCGACTQYLFDHRCLSVPNHCPKANQYLVDAFTHDPNPWVPKDLNTTSGIVCLDHKCEASKVGCCLTCF